MTIFNEEKNYRELKESIRLINSQKCDVEKISLIEGNKIGFMKLLSEMELLTTV